MMGLQCMSKDPPHVLEAVQWYSLAAQGDEPHPDALYNLGMIYYEGTAAGGFLRKATLV